MRTHYIRAVAACIALRVMNGFYIVRFVQLCNVPNVDPALSTCQSAITQDLAPTLSWQRLNHRPYCTCKRRLLPINHRPYCTCNPRLLPDGNGSRGRRKKTFETITDDVHAMRAIAENREDARRAHARPWLALERFECGDEEFQFVASVRAAFPPPPTLSPRGQPPQSSVAGATHLAEVPADGSRSFPRAIMYLGEKSWFELPMTVFSEWITIFFSSFAITLPSAQLATGLVS
jgi:hypothetical protein